MKIIQSLWSSPSRLVEAEKTHGGWNTSKQYLLSMALSCLQLRKYYEEVELITDSFGKYLLIDQMGLPYTSCSTELDHLSRYDKAMWALGKLHAYRIQTKPFLHVDNDVFIWKRFPERVEKAPVVVQSLEQHWDFFSDIAGQILRDCTFLPARFMNVIRETSYLPNYNAGILGGNNLKFFENYTTEVFDLVKSSFDQFPTEIKPLANLIFEQFFLYCMLNEEKINYEVFLDDSYLKEIYKQNALVKCKDETGYLHVHYRKREDEAILLLEGSMKDLYPDYYSKIDSLDQTVWN